MGYTIYAISDTFQSELEAELKSLSLSDSMRHSDINVWKSMFEFCAGVEIYDIQYIDVTPAMVQEYANYCKCIMECAPDDFEMPNDSNSVVATFKDIVKMYNFLSTCVKYNGYLYVELV